jgi:hypothetical protein
MFEKIYYIGISLITVSPILFINRDSYNNNKILNEAVYFCWVNLR